MDSDYEQKRDLEERFKNWPKEIRNKIINNILNPPPKISREEMCKTMSERQFMLALEYNFKSSEDVDEMLTFYHEHCGEEKEKEYREWLKPFIKHLSEDEFVKKFSYNKSWTEEEMRDYYKENCIMFDGRYLNEGVKRLIKELTEEEFLKVYANNKSLSESEKKLFYRLHH